MTAAAATLKQKTNELIDHFSGDITRRDLAYRSAARPGIGGGLADGAANLVTPVEEILKEWLPRDLAAL